MTTNNTDQQGAVFSPCKKYRYALWRIWQESKPCILFITLNPSVADETVDAPTLRRCMGYAAQWGYGGVYMGNLFAYRAPGSGFLGSVENPVGEDNDKWLIELQSKTGSVICAWGAKGTYQGRDREVLKLLDNPYCLGISKQGLPKHPLYLSRHLEPVKYETSRKV